MGKMGGGVLETCQKCVVQVFMELCDTPGTAPLSSVIGRSPPALT